MSIALQVEGERAERMVAAQMIRAAIADVRHQLGASYDLTAWLDESRRSTLIRVTGLIAAERSGEVIALLRDRLTRLAGGDADAARFLAARRAVVARLSLIDTGASALASHAEAAVDLGRSITGDLATAEAARRLTLAQLTRTLGSIDLRRAAVLLRGPRDAVGRAFTQLGLAPRVVE